MLVVGMALAALLAGGGAYYAAKATIEAKDDYWCSRAKGQIVNADDGSPFCAIRMQGYQGTAAEGGQ